VFLSGINSSKRAARRWKMMKDVVVQGFAEQMKNVNKSGIWCILMKLNLDKGTVTCIEMGLNVGLEIGFSTMKMLHLTTHSLSEFLDQT
jgi:hypothetical protein